MFLSFRTIFLKNVLHIVLAFAIVAIGQQARAALTWIEDPAYVGTQVPAVGQSLFEELFSGQPIPYPYSALIKNIAYKLGCKQVEQCMTQVLIPMGRSLQRNAAAPEFFRFPRVVTAITGEGKRGPQFKDRLYIGYQEKAAVLEIISYNSQAGRFEFQIVDNYRAGARPQLHFANRNVCISCHQNHAPIFSRPQWDETSANPLVAKRLLAENKRFYGVHVSHGVDVPAAIDAAVARANRISLYQKLWQLGCGENDAAARQCRATVLLAALQFRLSKGASINVHQLTAVRAQLLKNGQRLWPQGLAVAEANIPNRILQANTVEHGTKGNVELPAIFDALVPRAPSEVILMTPERIDSLVAEWVEGVAQMFSTEQIVKGQNSFASKQTLNDLQLACSINAGVSVQCLQCDDAGISIRMHKLNQVNTRWILDQFKISSDAARSGEAISADFYLNSGRRISQFKVVKNGSKSFVRMQLHDEFNKFALGLNRRAENLANVSDDFLSARPVNTDAIFPVRQGIAVVAKSTAPGVNAATLASPLYAYCALCHSGSEAAPPNFLHGEANQVSAQLSQCAPRIYYRLKMWNQESHLRTKTPMPPVTMLPNFVSDLRRWPNVVKDLQEYARSLLPATMRDNADKLILDKQYEALPSCLL